MPKVKFVKKARKDVPNSDIKKGESYYYWEFRNAGKQVSRRYPKRQQLTRSAYKMAIYDIEDMVAGADEENLENEVISILEATENLKEELEMNLEAVPEQLKESHVNNERIEMLEEAISGLENIRDSTDFGNPEEIDVALQDLENINFEA